MSAAHFLYVEDDEMSRMIAEILFSRVLKATHLTIFENSANFVERLKTLPEKPSAIFLDIQVGPHDGYEVLKMLRAQPEYGESTVIAMTANVMSNDVERLRAAGFNGLIGKPIMQDVFADLLQKILQGEQVWYVP